MEGVGVRRRRGSSGDSHFFLFSDVGCSAADMRNRSFSYPLRPGAITHTVASTATTSTAAVDPPAPPSRRGKKRILGPAPSYAMAPKRRDLGASGKSLCNTMPFEIGHH